MFKLSYKSKVVREDGSILIQINVLPLLQTPEAVAGVVSGLLAHNAPISEVRITKVNQ